MNQWTQLTLTRRERARRLEGSVGVLMLDLDHFKRINDAYGHLAGDAVLIAVADAIRRAVRSYDLVGRWGGEEFVVLLPGLTYAEVDIAAERIRATIAALTVVTINRREAEVTVTGLTASIGAGAFPDTAAELSPLLLAVDDALYRSKENGRNRTTLAGVEASSDAPID